MDCKVDNDYEEIPFLEQLNRICDLEPIVDEVSCEDRKKNELLIERLNEIIAEDDYFSKEAILAIVKGVRTKAGNDLKTFGLGLGMLAILIMKVPRDIEVIICEIMDLINSRGTFFENSSTSTEPGSLENSDDIPSSGISGEILHVDI